MPAWLAAIPVIGQLFESVGKAIDANVTTDEERLKLKADLTALYVPVLTAVMDAEKQANEMRLKLAEIELKSEHWLVWSRRPVIAYMSMINAVAANVMASFGYAYTDPSQAVTFAMLINGIDMGGRSAEKMLDKLKKPERPR